MFQPPYVEPIDAGIFARALQNSVNIELERSFDIGYHLADVYEDMKRFVAAVEQADTLTQDELINEIYHMVVHTPAHLMAAAHLLGHTPTDVFNLGIEVKPETTTE